MAKVNSSRINLKEGVEWAVKKYLEQYQLEVTREMTLVVPEVSKEAVKKLKASAPRRKGKYYKGWTYKVERGRMRVGATIYGRHGTYQLAHLLEHGHAKVVGGRRYSDPVPAKPHIEQVDEWVNGELIDRTIERLQGI